MFSSAGRISKVYLADAGAELVGDEAAQVALAVRQAPGEPSDALAVDDPVGDDLLRLIFTVCHPVLSREARAALREMD